MQSLGAVTPAEMASCDEVPLSYPLFYKQPITHILIKHINKQTPHKLDSSFYQTWIESFLRSVQAF